jgi:hypothetical protein
MFEEEERERFCLQRQPILILSMYESSSRCSELQARFLAA